MQEWNLWNVLGAIKHITYIDRPLQLKLKIGCNINIVHALMIRYELLKGLLNRFTRKLNAKLIEFIE